MKRKNQIIIVKVNMVHAATNFGPEHLMRLRRLIVFQVCEAGDQAGSVNLPMAHT